MLLPRVPVSQAQTRGTLALLLAGDVQVRQEGVFRRDHRLVHNYAKA